MTMVSFCLLRCLVSLAWHQSINLRSIRCIGSVRRGRGDVFDFFLFLLRFQLAFRIPSKFCHELLWCLLPYRVYIRWEFRQCPIKMLDCLQHLVRRTACLRLLAFLALALPQACFSQMSQFSCLLLLTSTCREPHNTSSKASQSALVCFCFDSNAQLSLRDSSSLHDRNPRWIVSPPALNAADPVGAKHVLHHHIQTFSAKQQQHKERPWTWSTELII